MTETGTAAPFAQTQPANGTLGPRLAGPACTRIADGVQTVYRLRVRYSTTGRYMRASTKVRYNLAVVDVVRTAIPEVA